MMTGLPSSGFALVSRGDRRADLRTASRMGCHPRRPAHAHRRADRLGKNARRVSDRDRRPRPRGRPIAAARRGSRRLRFAAQGAERGHSQEPRRAAAGASAACRNVRSRDSANHSGRQNRRHVVVRARGDAANAPAYPRDHPGIAVPAAHGGAQPADAALRPDGDRGRDPCGHRHAARGASGVDLGAAGGALRARGPAKTARLQRIGLSATQKPIDEVARFLVGADDDAGTLRHRGRGTSPRDGPGGRDPAVTARCRHVA